MLHLLKRHFLPIRASFDFVLSLTYGVPAALLARFISPGLRLDQWNGLGFIAAAFVQTRFMRPAFLPRFMGANYFFAGYRVFCRYRNASGREFRGLQIVRTDTDKTLMATAGNLLTHYNYRVARIDVRRAEDSLRIQIASGDGNGDVELSAQLAHPGNFLPPGSPFATVDDARHFAGPMPFTFNYEPETNSIVRVQGLRKHWTPRMIPVSIQKLSFLQQEAFAAAAPVLASCFCTEGVDYQWKAGVRERLAI